MIFIVNGAVKVVSFVMRTKTHWNIFVPIDNTTFEEELEDVSGHEHEQQTRRQLLQNDNTSAQWAFGGNSVDVCVQKLHKTYFSVLLARRLSPVQHTDGRISKDGRPVAQRRSETRKRRDPLQA